MKTKLLSLFLAVVTVVCMLPVAVFAAEGDDIVLTGTIFNQKTATWDYYQGNGLDPAFAFDGDESTFWLCGGVDLGVGADQYIGMNYGTSVNISGVKVITSNAHEDANSKTMLQVSEDGTTWVDAYELNQFAEGTLPTTEISYDEFTAEAKAIDIRQVRVWRTMDATNSAGEKAWHNLRVYELEVKGSYVVPEDAEMTVTMFDEPISTTFGTKANLLAEAYTMKTGGLSGITLLLKVDGIPYGGTAALEGVDISVTSEGKTPGSSWAGQWVYNARNYNVFEENGYYAYYFNFANLDDAGSVKESVADDTTLNSVTLFQTGSAWNWANGNQENDSTIDENISISLVGVVEGDITPSAVFAYDENGEYLGHGATTTSIDATANAVVWSRLAGGSDIYGGEGVGEADSAIVSWTDRDGEAIDFILGESKIIGKYGVAPVKFTALASDCQVGGAVYIDIYATDNYQTFNKATLNMFFDESIFTPYAVEGDLTQVFCENGVLTMALAEGVNVTAEEQLLGTVWLNISEDAFARAYEFFINADEMSNESGDVTNRSTVIEVIPAGRREGFYDLGTYAYNEELIVVETEYLPYEKSNNLTFIVEVKGLNGGTLKLGGVRVIANGIDSNNSGNYPVGTTYEITEDGYYALQSQLGLYSWVGSTFERITRIAVNDAGNTRGGASEFIPAEGDTESAPTVTYHAVYVGAPYASVQYGINGFFEAEGEYSLKGEWWKAVKLPTYAELYTGETPVKESEIPEVTYSFIGWADDNGEDVTAASPVGGGESVLASFKEIDMRTKYTVKFVNYDGAVLEEKVVPEGVIPEYTGETPKKPSTETKSYAFKGWDKEIVATPATPDVADGGDGGEIVYTAQYDETERRYDVTYYDEDGKTKLGETLGILRGEAALTDIKPTKEADVQYTYTFEKWVDLEGNDVDLSKVTADMSVKAVYTPILNRYTVTFDVDGNTTEVEVDYGTSATDFEATKAADEFYTYTFDKWVDADGNEADLSEVKGDMTVYAVFDATYVHPYEGEKIDSWALPAVEYVMVNGIMTGMDGGFKPKTNMSRAMVVTVLYRYMDEPTLPEGAKNIFTDVEDGKWYTNAIIWAAHCGVVDGKGAGKFDPNGNVTRQEFVTILYRFSDEVMDEYMGFGRSTLSNFYDKEQISGWAGTAVKWAFATAQDTETQGCVAYEKTQYINGKGTKDGKPVFAPKANATRAEVATMLYRYMTGIRLSKAEAEAQG